VPDPVLAAGAVVWRPGPDGIEVCVVHRPAYDDWSLPKGKLDDGEHPLVAAVREVREETGVHALPERRLSEVAYTLPDGRPKTVDFWLMRAADRPVVPVSNPAEVDAVEWLAPAAAATRLSYPHDRRLVEEAAARSVSAVTTLVRHAHAGERKAWMGNDALRPIDPQGQAEAERLGVLLALFEPELLIAATPLRCKQTLEPLAERLGRPIVTDGAFAEPPDAEDAPAKAKVAAARLAEIRAGVPAAISSQGKIIPPLLALLCGADDPEPYKTPKGGGWVLSWSGENLTGLTRL